MSDTYSIPKTRVHVEVRALAGEAEKAAIFLGESHRGPESVLDLLNGDHPFVVVEVVEGQVAFLRLAHITMVTLTDADAFAEHGGLELAADIATEAPLHLEFDDGTTLDGVAVYQLRESNARVQDFLNTSDRFFPLFHDECVSYVNKRRLARVTLR